RTRSCPYSRHLICGYRWEIALKAWSIGCCETSAGTLWICTMDEPPHRQRSTMEPVLCAPLRICATAAGRPRSLAAAASAGDATGALAELPPGGTYSGDAVLSAGGRRQPAHNSITTSNAG